MLFYKKDSEYYEEFFINNRTKEPCYEIELDTVDECLNELNSPFNKYEFMNERIFNRLDEINSNLLFSFNKCIENVKLGVSSEDITDKRFLLLFNKLNKVSNRTNLYFNLMMKSLSNAKEGGES